MMPLAEYIEYPDDRRNKNQQPVDDSVGIDPLQIVGNDAGDAEQSQQYDGEHRQADVISSSYVHFAKYLHNLEFSIPDVIRDGFSLPKGCCELMTRVYAIREISLSA